jgi:hypothetical protein
MKQKIGGSSRVANTESRIMENSANTKKLGYGRLRGGGARNRKKEKVLLQAKGQLHGGAQGVLPRCKNADCEICIKESWPRKKKMKSRTIGLTVNGP